MTNMEVARIFSEIADMLEIMGENPFRIRSYRKAAQAIESLTRDLKSLVQRDGTLEKVPGIGEGMGGKIMELLHTGRCAFYDELKSQLPSEILDFMDIPGVGPKMANRFWQELSITSTAELEKAARDQRLRGLKGLGPKIEEKILKGIEQHRKYKERHALGRVYPFCASLVSFLEADPRVIQVSPAGSIRRMKETIADIDILVTTRDPEPVMGAFCSQEWVQEVLASGKTKSSILSRLGVQVDLRAVDPKSFGAALHYFTGSKSHNIRMREFAQRKKIKLNEYGLFREKDDKNLGGETEEEVFKILGLPYIPPELREDNGEIEAALKDALPALITEANIRGDLHTHSKWSDGTTSIEEMAQAARKLGYEYMAVTDHTMSVGVAGGLAPDEVRRQMAEIRELNKHVSGFRILSGSEVDIKGDGSLDLPDDVLADLDIVLVAIHSRFQMPREEMTARIVKALSHPHVDVLVHPTGRLLTQREPYSVDMDEVMRVAKERRVALELNSFWDRLDLNDLNCRRAKEKGIMISIATDSHNPNHFQNIRFGIATARRGWLEPHDVLNSKSLEELEAWLSRLE